MQKDDNDDIPHQEPNNQPTQFVFATVKIGKDLYQSDWLFPYNFKV